MGAFTNSNIGGRKNTENKKIYMSIIYLFQIKSDFPKNMEIRQKLIAPQPT